MKQPEIKESKGTLLIIKLKNSYWGPFSWTFTVVMFAPGPFACKVRMCEISHLRTRTKGVMRVQSYFCNFELNLLARCECAKFRTFAPRTRAMCDQVRPKMVADAQVVPTEVAQGMKYAFLGQPRNTIGCHVIE